jgi:two-component system, OmpR family, KDP operon response regulator KdpE
MMRVTLVGHGFEVGDARSGVEALEQLRCARYDLVLLGINMRGTGGVEVCPEIRSASDVAIIMLTVRASEKDKMETFDAGADDFVTKPFDFSELLARMRATLRRRGRPLESECSRLWLGDTEIDFEARQVQVKDEEERLTPKEWDALRYLAAHANRTVTHRELLRGVWARMRAAKRSDACREV